MDRVGGSGTDAFQKPTHTHSCCRVPHSVKNFQQPNTQEEANRWHEPAGILVAAIMMHCRDNRLRLSSFQHSIVGTIALSWVYFSTALLLSTRQKSGV
eukprot:scaffold10821_cov199-Amphora_coffeaeformis.AAC.4